MVSFLEEFVHKTMYQARRVKGYTLLKDVQDRTLKKESSLGILLVLISC